MNYEIIDMHLDSGIIGKGDRKGERWEGVRATVRPLVKGLIAKEEARQRTKYFFENDTVALLKAFIGKRKGNATSPFEDNKPLPDDDRIQEHGFEVEVDMEGEFCRIYTNDVKDSEGRLLHAAGTRRVNSNGDYEPATRTMVVLAFKIEDNDPYAERPWRWSTLPIDIMRQIRARYYRPIEAFETSSAPSVENPSTDTAPQVNVDDAEAERQRQLEEARRKIQELQGN